MNTHTHPRICTRCQSSSHSLAWWTCAGDKPFSINSNSAEKSGIYKKWCSNFQPPAEAEWDKPPSLTPLCSAGAECEACSRCLKRSWLSRKRMCGHKPTQAAGPIPHGHSNPWQWMKFILKWWKTKQWVHKTEAGVTGNNRWWRDILLFCTSWVLRLHFVSLNR